MIKASQLSSTGALFLSSQDRNKRQNTHNRHLTAEASYIRRPLFKHTEESLFVSAGGVRKILVLIRMIPETETHRDSDVIPSRDAQKQKLSRLQFGSERVNSLSTRLGSPAFSAPGCSPCVSMGRADSSAAADGRGGRTNPGWPAEPQDLFLTQQELKRCSFKPVNRR